MKTCLLRYVRATKESGPEIETSNNFFFQINCLVLIMIIFVSFFRDTHYSKMKLLKIEPEIQKKIESIIDFYHANKSLKFCISVRHYLIF